MEVGDILKEHEALNLLVAEYQKAKKEDKAALEDAIKQQAEKIERMGEVLKQEVAEAYPELSSEDGDEEVQGKIEIELTPEQRERVLAQTGVDVPSVILADPDAILTKNMSFVELDFVEAKAMEVAQSWLEMAEEAKRAFQEGQAEQQGDEVDVEKESST